ncbi:MAG: hypothetical protein RLZZ618_1039 [Pseudomonadota bacterium]
MSLFVWRSHVAPGHCTLQSGRFSDTARTRAGEPLAADFSAEHVFSMSKMFPDDIVLSDNFVVAAQVIVSEALKTRLQTLLADHAIEYLPVAIRNHKGRVVPERYFIVHPLGLVDCIDLARSKVKWHQLIESNIISCDGLVFKPEAVAPSVKLFRPQHWGQHLLVSAGLAEELMSSGLTGLQFMPATGFNGISSPLPP